MEFEERALDTEAKTELIMKNIFSDPPVLVRGEKILTPEEMFTGEELNVKFLEVKLNE